MTKKPINVAFLIDTIAGDTAGTQKQLLETIRRLDRKKYKPILICLWQTDWMLKNTLPCNLFILGYKGFLKANFPGVIKKLQHIIKVENIRILQTFFEDSIFVGFFGKLTSKKRICLISSRRDIGLGKENQPWYHRLFAIALPVVNLFFDGLLTNSRQVKEFVVKREKVKQSKVKVIYNGVDPPQYTTALPQYTQQKEQCVRIGIVASLTPVKRHDVLINALFELQNMPDLPEIHVVIIGEGKEHSRLEAYASSKGVGNSITFTGAITNVADHLRYLDIGILCSDREGLSNAILEYMSCGLPVIATSVGGNVELVDESNGILFPPGDSSACAAAIEKLVRSDRLRKELGQQSRKKVERNFSWNITLQELDNYYTALLRQS